MEGLLKLIDLLDRRIAELERKFEMLDPQSDHWKPCPDAKATKGAVSWVSTAARLRERGWEVTYHPVMDLPPYHWRSPRGEGSSKFRSYHPDAPPEAVMQNAYTHCEVDYTDLVKG